MILFVCAKLNDIYAQGRNFNWKKPDQCPRCGSMRLWGHGFVLAYFDQFSHGLYLRRFRCPDCNCIIRMKVKGYFARFHTSIHTIRSCLEHRLSCGRWLTALSTSRQRHWLAALKRKTMAVFGATMDLMAAFECLITKGDHTGQPRHLGAKPDRFSKALPNSAFARLFYPIYSRQNTYERRVFDGPRQKRTDRYLSLRRHP